MQPSTKVRRKNGRNYQDRRQTVTPKLRAGMAWAREYAALERALNDPDGNVVSLRYAVEQEFQWS